MKNFKLRLSSKVRDDGKSQIIVRADITRTLRPKLKTGVFIHPELFDAKNGKILVLKKGKLNASLADEANDAQVALDRFCSRISMIAQIGVELDIELTTEWITKIIELDNCGELTYRDKYGETINKQSVEEALAKEKAKEQEAVKQKQEAENTLDIYTLIYKYIEAKTLSAGTAAHYHVLSRQLRRFEKFVQLTDQASWSINVHTLTREDVENFYTFLKDEYTLSLEYPTIFKRIEEQTSPKDADKKKIRAPKDKGTNYLSSLMKKLIAVFNWLNVTGRTENKPFVGYVRKPEIYATPIYLTMEELKKIETTDLTSFSKVIQEQRDIYVFQCCIGCRVSDLIELKEENINGEILSYIPKKTHNETNPVSVRVPLNDRAKTILDKYIEFRSHDEKGRLLPFISPQNYNERIKDVFNACGITRFVPVRDSKTGETKMVKISEIAASHMARRTFAGNVYKAVKDPNIVCRLTGHKEGSQAFLRYRNIDDDMLRDAVSNMN